MSKCLSKYIASFDYFDKSLIISSVTIGGTSITSFATFTGAPVGIVSASFSQCVLKQQELRRKNTTKLLC